MTELTINELMRLKMTERGLNEKEVAKLLGVSESTVKKLLETSRNPWIETIWDFFEAINCRYEMIYRGKVSSIPFTISTLWKLQQKAPGFSLRFKDGSEYKVAPVKQKEVKPHISL